MQPQRLFRQRCALKLHGGHLANPRPDHRPTAGIGARPNRVAKLGLIKQLDDRSGKSLGTPERHQPAVIVGKQFLGMPRSEEHTSELQSLMRISYAVFCLLKKYLN